MARRSSHKAGQFGKRIVYVTQYRNAAVEVMKMYQKKGWEAGIEREMDPTGQALFIVYTW
jgi:hypothetical protein